MRVICVSVEPVALPTFTSPCPVTDEEIELAISGRSVPIATTVTPTRPVDRSSRSAMSSARSTARRLA